MNISPSSNCMFLLFSILLADPSAVIGSAGSRQSSSSTSPVAFAFPSNNQNKEWNNGMVATTTAKIAFLSIMMAPTPPAFATESSAKNLANGAALLQANGAVCHAGGQNVMASQKTLQKEALEKFQSLDQAKLPSFVPNGMQRDGI